jgi:pimeloyl-ACP methyl ester carboxylesterase
LLRTLVGGVSVGLVASVTLIAAVYDAETSRPTLAPTGLSFVRTGAYLTRYESWGRSSANPVVLVHGAFESVDYWKPVATLLSRMTHVEAYDLEGYGYTQRVGPYDASALATQLYEFLRARHLDHPVLVGHSLGAGVIARFVLEYPRVAAGIVFLDGDGLSLGYPATQLVRWIPNLYMTALYRYAVRNDFLVAAIFRGACGPRCPAVTAAVLAMVQRPFEVARAQSALLAYAAQPLVGVSVAQLRRIKRLGIRARVIFGADDTEYSSATPRLTAQRLGAPAPEIIAGAGHLSLWSSPGPVAAAIDRFVWTLSSSKH